MLQAIYARIFDKVSGPPYVNKNPMSMKMALEKWKWLQTFKSRMFDKGSGSKLLNQGCLMKKVANYKIITIIKCLYRKF